ncbi:MAG TPA: acyl-CoA dehydrogenase family protein [Acidimicrobiales bacterium]|jgi:alkylation response protein AidB-like acyl-CoA dehydrogenase|nr:acyl-CoA dehydrogenase family protein [Acidimicrobiales bacterium]
MDLDFTDEQELLRETVRGVCARHCGLDVVRALEDDPVGYPEKLWVQLAELGLLYTDLSMIDLAIIHREFGRSLAPSPAFASVVMSRSVLEAAGEVSWRTGVESGESIVVPAWLEPDRGFGPAGVQARLEGGRVSGVKRHVPFAAAADRLLVLARGADDRIALALVDPKADGVTLAQQLTVGSDAQYRVDLDDAAAEVVTEDGWPLWHAAMLDGIILLAAQAVGGARYALDITVQYAKDRFQFDKPLGAFQSIAHYLSDAVTALDGAELLVWEAAWARTEGRPITRLAPMAKLFACRTFRDITAMSQQVFGGVGFTVEYDIQLYFRRAKQLQLSWWDDRHLEELIASEVLG